jgi:hypothetical protein
MLPSKITDSAQNTVSTVVADTIPPINQTIAPIIKPDNRTQLPELNPKEDFLYRPVKQSILVEQVEDVVAGLIVIDQVEEIVVDLVQAVEDYLPTKTTTTSPVPVLPTVKEVPQVLPPPCSVPARCPRKKMVAAPMAYRDRAYNAIQFPADFNDNFANTLTAVCKVTVNTRRYLYATGLHSMYSTLL